MDPECLLSDTQRTITMWAASIAAITIGVILWAQLQRRIDQRFPASADDNRHTMASAGAIVAGIAAYLFVLADVLTIMRLALCD